MIPCNLSSASCSRICKLQPVLRLELPAVTCSSEQSLQLLLSSAAGYMQGSTEGSETEGPDRNKVKNQSLHGALPPELRDPP